MSVTNQQEQRLFSWNGLDFQAPSSWEIIVSGPTHILIEKNFQPVMEIRWQHSSPTISTPEQIRKRLQKELEIQISDVPLPAALRPLRHNFKTIGLSWHPKEQLNGLIATCHKCGTLFLCRFYPHDEISPDTLFQQLNSMNCHTDRKGEKTWKTQDFSLFLPSPFTLTDYTFAAGLTKLSFCSEHLHIHTCRLAPAKERLATTCIEKTLETLHGQKYFHSRTRENAINNTCHSNSSGETCEQWSTPSFTRQILMRFKKKKPFFWARIWHLPEQDRVLAIVFESIRPISEEVASSICKRYEIT